MFAARAGAAKVYAIEASALADKARENIRKNGFEKVITYLPSWYVAIHADLTASSKARSRISRSTSKLTLSLASGWSVVTVELQISADTQGYMLLYESMLDSVL